STSDHSLNYDVHLRDLHSFPTRRSSDLSTTLTTRTFRSGMRVRRIDAAASTSTVGMSPAQPRTTSGSSPSTSVPAHGQIPTPRVQWRTASSIVNQLGLGCFPHTTTLTYWVERRQWSNVERSVLASGGRYTRTTSAFLLTTWSMKPGSWWEHA